MDDEFIDFAKLAPDWVDPTAMTDEERAAEYARQCATPDRAAEIEAALAEKANVLPIDILALGY